MDDRSEIEYENKHCLVKVFFFLKAFKCLFLLLSIVYLLFAYFIFTGNEHNIFLYNPAMYKI